MAAFDAIIFDMDGTLLDSRLDFAAIRRELDIPPGMGLLEALAELPPDEHRLKHQKLLEIELAAAERAELIEGAEELLAAVRAAGLPSALLTRNSRRVAELAMRRFDCLRFDHVRCREDGVIKPEPDGVHACCDVLGHPPPRVLCVGDYQYDLIAAHAAGCPFALLTTMRHREGWETWAPKANWQIDRLADLPAIIGIPSWE